MCLFGLLAELESGMCEFGDRGVGSQILGSRYEEICHKSVVKFVYKTTLHLSTESAEERGK
jgi:hypothetical protein